MAQLLTPAVAEPPSMMGPLPDNDRLASDADRLGSPKRSMVGDLRQPLPYPNGWFMVSLGHDVTRGQVRTVPFMGQELVLYRTASGLARAIEPYCPHLGAHLGHGGKVQGEDLICPLHGLVFGPDGRCLRASYGEKPHRAALTGRHMKEVNGAILVWTDSDNRPPTWDVPEHDLSNFCPPGYTRHHLRGQAHDAVENGVDLAHFVWLHGFTDARMSHRIDAHLFETTLDARWKGQQLTVHFLNYGVGHAVVAFSMPALGLRMKSLGYFTQTAPFTWTLVSGEALSISRVERLPGIVRNLSYAVLGPLAQYWVQRLVAPDLPIWNAKSYLPRPKLTGTDATAAAHRRWASQFYPTLTDRSEGA